MGDLVEVFVFLNLIWNEINIRNLFVDVMFWFFDLNGCLLLDRNYVNWFDLSKYSKGVYIFFIYMENVIWCIKVVKD